MFLRDIENFIGGTWLCRENNTTWRFQRNVINDEWYLLEIKYENTLKEQKYKINYDRIYNEYYMQTEYDGDYKIININSSLLEMINNTGSAIALYRLDR